MTSASTNGTENDNSLQTTSSGAIDVEVNIEQVFDTEAAQRLAQLLTSNPSASITTTSSGAASRVSIETGST